MQIIIDLGPDDHADCATIASVIVAIAHAFHGYPTVHNDSAKSAQPGLPRVTIAASNQATDSSTTDVSISFTPGSPRSPLLSPDVLWEDVSTRVRSIIAKGHFTNVIGPSEAGMLYVALEGYYAQDDTDRKRRRLLLDLFEAIMLKTNEVEDATGETLYYSLVADGGSQSPIIGGGTSG